MQRVRVLARVHAVDPVVSAHHRADPGLDRRVKRREIDLLHGPLAGVRGVGHAVGLLVVERVVLDRRDHVLRLDPLDDPGARLPGQVRVLAGVLEVAPVQWIARDVDAGSEQHVHALGERLAAEDGSVLLRQLRIPGRGERDAVGERRGQRLLIAHAGGRVVQDQRRDAQRGVCRDVAGRRRVRRGRVELPLARDHRDLVGRRHRAEQLGGPLGRCLPRVHPRAGGSAGTWRADAHRGYHGSRGRGQAEPTKAHRILPGTWIGREYSGPTRALSSGNRQVRGRRPGGKGTGPRHRSICPM